MSVKIKEETAAPEVETPPAAAAAPETTAAPEPKEAPAADEPSPGAPEEGEVDPAAAAAPTFKARDKFKYRVFETEEQKEENVPEWLKSVMKDEASEKEAISLLEKAYGLEPVKASRAAVALERDQLKTENLTIQQTISDVRKTYQRGDIDAFLDKLAIPHERMLQWALDKVNYSQLPPDQQRVLDERREAQRQAWAAEQRSSSVEQQLHEQASNAKRTLLQSSLARPDVSTFATQFDTQAGKPGAFFEEVRATGELAWINSKVDLTPDQAIEQVMKKWSRFLPSGAQASGTPPAAAAPTVVPTAKPAVIPNVQGRGSSPVKSGPRSLDDLRKLGAQAGRQ